MQHVVNAHMHGLTWQPVGIIPPYVTPVRMTLDSMQMLSSRKTSVSSPVVTPGEIVT